MEEEEEEAKVSGDIVPRSSKVRCGMPCFVPFVAAPKLAHAFTD